VIECVHGANLRILFFSQHYLSQNSFLKKNLDDNFNCK
jgi:hypothetical protein